MQFRVAEFKGESEGHLAAAQSVKEGQKGGGGGQVAHFDLFITQSECNTTAFCVVHEPREETGIGEEVSVGVLMAKKSTISVNVFKI